MNENSIQQPESNSMGAVLGSIIVIIILLVAAFYLWGNRPATTPATVEDIGVTASEVLDAQDPQTTSLQTQSDADNLGAIDADLKSTNVNDLTPEVNSIEQEVAPTVQ